MGVWWIFLFSFHLLFTQSICEFDSDSMDDFIHFYGQKSLMRSKTGTLYDLSLPGNFSGIKASIVRFRTRNLWRKGANLSFLQIPSRVVTTMPFVNRLDLIFQDLGNWSNSYFHVPNHTFLTSVLGFRAYEANSTNRIDQFGSLSDSVISVRFSLAARNEDRIVKCVRFVSNGSFEFIDMTRGEFTCETVKQGHFTIVAPNRDVEEEKRMIWKWWVVGFFVGLGFLIFLLVSFFALVCVWRRNMILTMEKRSETDVTLETTWIGRSRMPTAAGIRTQPSLEDEYVS